MYIQFHFQKSGTIISLDDPDYQAPVFYSISKPFIFDKLPENARENTMIEESNGDKNYYLDCGDLDLAAVEKIVKSFADENLPIERSWDRNGSFHGTRQITLPEQDGMPLINTLLEAVVKAKLKVVSNNHLASQSLFSNKALLWAAGGFAVGVAATLATTSMMPRNN